MARLQPVNAAPVTWVESAPHRLRPPLDAGLSGWEVQKRRASHWNAKLASGDCLYYLKWFFHSRLRSSPARREWENARRVAELGIRTVTPTGWGRHARGTFIVLEGSPGHPGDAWRGHGMTMPRLRRLVRELAGMAAALHDADLCHRDLNVYHVLVDEGGLRLIDIGRVALFLRRRWIVKDLGSLLHSARREGYPWWSCRLFLREYLARTRRRWRRRRLAAAAARRAEWMGRRERP